jgi:hypothetical protein
VVDDAEHIEGGKGIDVLGGGIASLGGEIGEAEGLRRLHGCCHDGAVERRDAMAVKGTVKVWVARWFQS